MSIVLPIVFFAVGLGLFVQKMTPRLWALLVMWIVLVVVYNYIKPQTAPAAQEAAASLLPASSDFGCGLSHPCVPFRRSLTSHA